MGELKIVVICRASNADNTGEMAVYSIKTIEKRPSYAAPMGRIQLGYPVKLRDLVRKEIYQGV